MEVEFQPALNSNSGSFLKESAMQGLGISKFPVFIAEAEIASHKLIPLLQDQKITDGGICLTHPEDRRSKSSNAIVFRGNKSCVCIFGRLDACARNIAQSG